jgi:DNA polymerase-3 subunit delta'
LTQTSLHPLCGHEAERRVLARAHREGTLPSALLLYGTRGVGKQRLALWIAQLVLCESPAEEPCGRCHSCRLALALQHPDIHWHFPLERPKGVSGDRLGDALEDERAKALAERRRAPIRFDKLTEPAGIYLAAVQTLRRRAYTRPAMAREQVFVVGDADALVTQEASQEAANAILKLLEEPPAASRFILTSSEPGRLLPTVRSRMVPLHVGRLPPDLVRRFLVQAGFEPGPAERAARLGEGSIGRALGFLPDANEDGAVHLEALRVRALEILGATLAPGRSDAFRLAMTFPPTGARALTDLLDFVEAAFRDLAAIATGVPERAVNPEAAGLLARSHARTAIDPTDAARTLMVIDRARELARGNVNPQLLIAGLIEELRRTLAPSAAVGASVR